MEKLENIDIEKSKELFAYEMTEVLLMLKGEFATVSGKNMRYEQWAVAAENQTIPSAHIPTVQLEQDQLSLPAVNIPEVIKIPDAPTLDTSVSLPPVPDFDLGQLPQVSVKAQRLAVPAITPMGQKVSVPQVPVRKISVPIPASTDLPKAKNWGIDVQKIDLTLPQVNMPQPNSVISVSINPIKVQIPEVPGFGVLPIKNLVYTDCSVAIPRSPQLPQIDSCCVQIHSTVLEVPAASRIPQYVPQTVSVALPVTKAVIVPAMPKIPGSLQIKQESNLTEESMVKLSACIEKLENKPTFMPKDLVLEKKTAHTPQFVDVADAVSQFRAALGV